MAHPLVAQIVDRASEPLARARALPGSVYWDPDLYAFEVERIFRREWMCVARVEQLPNVGDYLALDLVGEPIVIVRDDSGALRALSRVCAHRSMDVLEGADDAGTAARFTCPYHLWSYRLDGSCIGATDMGESEIFDKRTVRLGEFPLTEWQGFVFVNFDCDASPLAPRMVGIERVLGDIDLSSWQLVRTLDWGEQPANWKVVIENGAECYHHMGTHRDTLEPAFPHNSIDVTLSPGHEWLGGFMVIEPAFATGEADGYPIHPTFFAAAADGLSPIQRASTLVAGVWPMFSLAMSPDFVTWFRWFPTGPESHRVDLNVLVPPSAAAQADREEVLDQIENLLNAIQAQDAATNAAVQRMTHSPFSGNGPLSHLEYPIWQFQRFLASRLADAELATA
jgi:phenylpropionate dioxygenase-like ring-hydroxylating dioxygenase large terminal subunit